MKKNLKHLALYVFATWILILLLRLELVVDLVKLMLISVKLFFTKPSFIISQIDLKFLDFISSLIIFLSIISFIYYSHKKKLLITRFNAGRLFLLLVVSLSLITPLLTPLEPNFYKDINVTRLLPPMSKMQFAVLNAETGDKKNLVEDFIAQKNKVFNKSNEADIIYFDSLKIFDSVRIYQNSEIFKFSKEDFRLSNNLPVIESRIFILGTDEFGRDIFTRIFYGMRLSLFIAVGSVLICFILGTTLGFISGYYGGWLDILLSRIVDVFLTFPGIFFVILSISLFGNSLLTVIVVLGLTGWMSLYKIVKGEVISIKNKDYFLTAQKIGLNKFQLLIKEIFPVIVSPVIVNLLLQFSSVIIAESALSYLGLGMGLNYPSLGAMINSGQEYFTSAWWLSVLPGITIIGLILIFNSIGDRINAKLNSRLLQ